MRGSNIPHSTQIVQIPNKRYIILIQTPDVNGYMKFCLRKYVGTSSDALNRFFFSLAAAVDQYVLNSGIWAKYKQVTSKIIQHCIIWSLFNGHNLEFS